MLYEKEIPGVGFEPTRTIRPLELKSNALTTRPSWCRCTYTLLVCKTSMYTCRRLRLVEKHKYGTFCEYYAYHAANDNGEPIRRMKNNARSLKRNPRKQTATVNYLGE